MRVIEWFIAVLDYARKSNTVINRSIALKKTWTTNLNESSILRKQQYSEIKYIWCVTNYYCDNRKKFCVKLR